MDEFDIIDLVYNHVAAAGTEMTVYKDRSVTGETENHIVISDMEYHEFDWENVLPVNVNIFIKLSAQSGMPNRTLMRETKRKVRAELLKITPENGKYQSIELSGSVKLTGAKEGFDCTNIKVIINVEKNIEDYGY
jgi:hypothetical protein